MRLFVAIRLSEDVKDHLSAAAEILRRTGRGNFTRAENLHLTLAFIGETDRIDAAKRALAQVEAAPFKLCLGKSGHFGDLYWAGAELNEGLKTLEREVRKQLLAEGFLLESRPFKPHLTLVREYRSTASYDKTAFERALSGASCSIEEVVLMESTRSGGKLIYRPIARKQLNTL